MGQRSAFFVSDHTGITAEKMGRSLLSQFPGVAFERITLPFIDTEEKARRAAVRIRNAALQDGSPPLVVSTVIDPNVRALLADSGGVVLDLFELFLPSVEASLHLASVRTVGRAHGYAGDSNSRKRIDAVKFAMTCDDGAGIERYGEADLILVGVSRAGKTPVCLYLALLHGIRAANYPLTESDLQRDSVPSCLQPFRERLFGLAVDADLLQQIRQERKPNTRYASLTQCRREAGLADEFFHRQKIRFLNASRRSVEEIAAQILQETGFDRRAGGRASPGGLS